MGEEGRGKSSGEMARSGSSSKVGSGRNKGKMAAEAKRNKGWELEMEETGGGGFGPPCSPLNLFQIFLKYMPILINR